MGLCLVALQCTLELLTECRRKLQHWLPLPLRSRSLLRLKGSILFGLVDPFWPLSPPSNRCGSPSKSMMRAAHPSFTGSASKGHPFSLNNSRCSNFDSLSIDGIYPKPKNSQETESLHSSVYVKI